MDRRVSGPASEQLRYEWPALPVRSWESTRDTLHLWTQMVGKTRLALTPLLNHWWNVPLYVNAVGLTTSLMPVGSHDSLEGHLRLRRSPAGAAYGLRRGTYAAVGAPHGGRLLR